MHKKAVVVLVEGFEEIEAITVIDVLRRGGIDVTVAALDGLDVKGAHGVTVNADRQLAASEDMFDACVFPGGMPGASNLAASESVNGLIAQMNKSGKIIAAICASPAVVLVPTGILDNKSATCYPAMQDRFGKSTVYKEQPVVIDGNIITSRGPATAFEFALAIAGKLCGSEKKQALAKALLIADGVC